MIHEPPTVIMSHPVGWRDDLKSYFQSPLRGPKGCVNPGSYSSRSFIMGLYNTKKSPGIVHVRYVIYEG